VGGPVPNLKSEKENVRGPSVSSGMKALSKTERQRVIDALLEFVTILAEWEESSSTESGRKPVSPCAGLISPRVRSNLGLRNGLDVMGTNEQ
jgi:hypothetical protein